MSLRQLNLQLSYRTGRGDMVKDLFVPCLEQSILYRRAAGYFTSFGLGLAARGVASLASRSGTMRLVASPHLEPADVEALRAAAERPEEVLRGIVARNMGEIEDAILSDRLNALAWLAASGCLEIRLALRLDEDGRIARGIFHEKTGIFTDENEEHVAFSGSSNETAGGLVENFESVDVFRSWNDPDERVSQKISDFDALWENTTPGLHVINFTAAGVELLEYYRDPSRPPPGFIQSALREDGLQRKFEPPPGFDLRPYQGDAIREWSRAGGRGILAMATGSGKTLTALYLASKVAAKNSPLVLIIVCPYINLCKQWLREMTPFGLRPIACYEGRQRWESGLEEGYQLLSIGLTKVHAIVTTNATFQSDAFQSRIRARVGSFHHLLIADECHNLGADSIQKVLPDEIQLRLGLSATPERHHDPVGTQAIVDYFGGVVYEFPLARAIADGRLCSYRYNPHIVSLTDDETEEYAEITAKLGRMIGGKEKDNEIGQAAMRLLIRRSRLLATFATDIAKAGSKRGAAKMDGISNAIELAETGSEKLGQGETKFREAVHGILKERLNHYFGVATCGNTVWIGRENFLLQKTYRNFGNLGSAQHRISLETRFRSDKTLRNVSQFPKSSPRHRLVGQRANCRLTNSDW